MAATTFLEGKVFRKKINLQRDGNEAKVYQVNQVRYVILKYKLGEDE